MNFEMLKAGQRLLGWQAPVFLAVFIAECGVSPIDLILSFFIFLFFYSDTNIAYRLSSAPS